MILLFLKQDKVLWNVLFLSLSALLKTTGESHVLVTDENGMASTESSWTPHSQNTNKGTSADDGIWFGQDALGTQAPVDDNLRLYLMTPIP